MNNGKLKNTESCRGSEKDKDIDRKFIERMALKENTRTEAEEGQKSGAELVRGIRVYQKGTEAKQKITGRQIKRRIEEQDKRGTEIEQMRHRQGKEKQHGRGTKKQSRIYDEQIIKEIGKQSTRGTEENSQRGGKLD